MPRPDRLGIAYRGVGKLTTEPGAEDAFFKERRLAFDSEGFGERLVRSACSLVDSDAADGAAEPVVGGVAGAWRDERERHLRRASMIVLMSWSVNNSVSPPCTARNPMPRKNRRIDSGLSRSWAASSSRVWRVGGTGEILSCSDREGAGEGQ